MGQLLRKRQGYAPVGKDIAAKITLEHRAEKNRELVVQRLIQMHLRPVGRLNFWSRPRSQGNACRISRDRMQHQKKCQHRQENDDDG